MRAITRRLSVPAVLMMALALGACGEGEKETSSGTAPETVTLTGENAAVLGAADGAEATVYENPADSPGAVEATAEPDPKAQARSLVRELAKDSNSQLSAASAAGIEWVTVKSPDGAFSMDIPKAWEYTSYPTSAGTAFGAVEGGLTARFAQYISHGDRDGNESIGDFMDSGTSELSSQRCRPGPLRTYEDTDFKGEARAFQCADGRSVYYLVLEGNRTDNSSYMGYFAFGVKDALGLAALERGFTTLDFTSS